MVAKSFIFTRVAVDASVGQEGSLGLTEARTYAFDGSFTWATRRVPLPRAQRIHSIRVADERGPYVQSASGEPGTFTVRRDDEGVGIRWNFRASDESKTFTLAYVIEDVVTVYDDVAELYWKFIGPDWDEPSRDVVVTVRLPARIPASQIRVWGHGPLHGEARPVAAGAVLTVRDLPARTMVEGRILFPREAVPGARNRKAEVALPRILREEGAWAAQANRTRLFQRVLLMGFSALPILAIGGWLILYVIYGREPIPRPPEGYYRELPAEYSPAELGVLWRFGSVQPADFVATILDLVRRGYMKVETATEQGLIFRDETYTLERTGKHDGLGPSEAEALAILFGSSRAEGERVTISRRKGLPAEAKQRMTTRFSTWQGSVKRAARAHRFFDETSFRMRWVALVVGLMGFLGAIATLGVGAALNVPGLTGVAIASCVGCLALTAGSGAVMRRSQRGADDLRRWQGFRQFLLDFSEMPRAELPLLTLWEQYLVYAVPLGVAHRVVEQLKQIYPAEALVQSPTLHMWSSPAGRGGGGDPLGAFSAFTTAFSAVTSSATSPSGGGGGFSGGGGGF
ncbi:MAG: DUF2207 domain-containing protein, partial [Armatimonadetes bacterium]|nr:DUF2207 domain-containing protein [Armatimonadota bacterium]